MTPLRTIKVIHTGFWLFFVSMIGYVIYSGWINAIDAYTWAAVGIVCIEGIILLANGGKCPLTRLAARYADPTSDNFDIYLPNWLARHNVLIFTSLFFAGLGLVLFRTIL